MRDHRAQAADPARSEHGDPDSWCHPRAAAGAQRDRGGFDEGGAHAVDIGPDGIEDIGRSSDELRVRTSPPNAGDAACPAQIDRAASALVAALARDERT